MALALNDRVQQTGTANTTVSFTLSGSVGGFQSFAVVGNGNTTYYTAFDGSGNWEVGLGTYSTTGPTLTRTTVLSSSNSNTAVTFSGTVNVFVTYPSSKSVNLDGSGNVSALGTIASGTWQGTTVATAYGGTGVTASTGANSVVLRDSNENIVVNSVTQELTKTVSAGGTTTLTAASSHFQVLTGTLAQTYKLPDATSLPTGSTWVFDNDSTQNLTIQDNALATIDVVPPGGYTTVFLEANGTVAGEWGRFGMLPNEVNWGTNSLALASTVISGGTWQGGTIGTAYGGTNLTTFTAANNAIYSTSASALAAGTLPVLAGGTGVTTSTGSGSVVLATSPTLVTPLLGTPTSGNFSTGTFTWPTFNQSTTGSAATLTTGRTIAITGDLAYTSGSFNGSANVTGTGTLATVNANVGSFTNASLTVNAKGLITAASSGTAPVTSVTGTSPVASSGGATPAISLAAAYGDTLNPYASKTANFVLAAPTGVAGVPTFRAIVAADIPTLNQNTTGSSGSCTGNSATATTATTADALNTANSYTGANFTATGSLIIGSSGTYAAGSIYSDANWGMIFRGKQASPVAAEFMWANSAGTELFRYNGSALTTSVTGTAANVTGTVAIANGGTGATSAAAALTALGAYPSSNPSGYTSNTGTVTGVTATSPVASSGGTAPVISMPAATTSVSGYLTSTDWNTFNSKGSGTVTSVTGTAPVVSSGGATPAISMAAATTSVSGYLTSTDWNTFNGKQAALGFTPYNATNPSNYIALASAITGYTVGTNTALAATDTLLAGLGKIQGQINARGTGNGTVTSVATGTGLSGGPITASGTISLANTAVTAGSYTNTNITVDAQGRITAAANGSGGGVTSVTGTAPVVSSGGATPAISMAAATTSVNGYLTSTDWNTFNGKQAALGFTPYNSTNPNNYIALASAITGYTVGTNTALAATDTLLAGLGKIQGQINARGTGNGTVTSVGGTGTVSGLTLTGTVTTTGNLTLGGTLSLVSPGAIGSTTASTGAFTTVTATGNITAYFSDERLKTRLGTIENALAKVQTLDGFYYEPNETAQALGYEVKREVGVSAQQVQAILPEIIAPAPIDNKYLTVDYERLVPLLIEAIKELKAEVDELKKDR